MGSFATQKRLLYSDYVAVLLLLNVVAQKHDVFVWGQFEKHDRVGGGHQYPHLPCICFSVSHGKGGLCLSKLTSLCHPLLKEYVIPRAMRGLLAFSRTSKTHQRSYFCPGWTHTHNVPAAVPMKQPSEARSSYSLPQSVLASQISPLARHGHQNPRDVTFAGV